MIDLSRTVTFGQYINNGSPLTRMDPRTKLFCAFVLIAVLSFLNTFAAFGICLLLILPIQALSRISPAYVLRGFKPFLGFLLFIFCAEVLFFQNPAHTPLLWHWWILNVSWTGLLRSLLTIVRVLFLYYLVSMLTFSTSLTNLTDGIEALLSPLHRLGIPISVFTMILVIAFKFVPLFIAEVERLIKAQSARGVRFDQGNIVQRTLKLAPLLIPLFVNGFKRAETLSVAMEARGYGSHAGWRRSKRRVHTFTRFDALVLCYMLVVCITAVFASVISPI
jgi:energy-coupling factor transport system permease protein